MLFATMWNIGIRIGEARTLTPESFDLGELRPFVRVLSEKARARRGRPPKDEVRLKLHTSDGKLDGDHRPRRREPLCAVTDETMRNWLKQAVKRAEADGVFLSVPVTPHTFRHSYIIHMLYHRQPKKVIQSLVGHKDLRSMEVYTRVFALEPGGNACRPVYRRRAGCGRYPSLPASPGSVITAGLGCLPCGRTAAQCSGQVKQDTFFSAISS